MLRAIKALVFAQFLALFIHVGSANAMMGMNWGTGMWGGMQACPYPQAMGSGATSVDDDIKETDRAHRKAKEEHKRKERKLQELKRKQASLRGKIARPLAEYGDFILKHMDEGIPCHEYQGYQPPDRSLPEGGPTKGENSLTRNRYETGPFKSQQWAGRYCAGRGRVRASAVCGDLAGGERTRSCVSDVEQYSKNANELRRLEDEVAASKQEMEALKEALASLKGDRKDELKERRREILEGGICLDCIGGSSAMGMQRRETDWGSVIANVGIGALMTYAGHQMNKSVISNNSAMGWPTGQLYPALGYGAPFFTAGLYGAIGGGAGHGAFGCAGGMGGGGFPYGANGMMGPFGPYGGMYGPYGGMNSPFGMPQGMFGSPWGGGMFMPGMGPWGMAGPWGGMGLGGAFPMGMPMGGYPMMSGPMGMMLGGVMGGVMGMPMGGMPMGGMPMGGYPMAGGMMGMPMMGNMIGGGIAMGYPMIGGPMSGYAMGAMMGMPMGGMMGMQMGAGIPMGGMQAGQAQMQYQQQLMQMQMQQYQQYMQTQQRAQQNYMQTQQVSMQLQQEISSLMMRLQQVQMGAYSGGYGGIFGGGAFSPGLGGVFGTTPIGGASVTPVPGPSGR